MTGRKPCHVAAALHVFVAAALFAAWPAQAQTTKAASPAVTPAPTTPTPEQDRQSLIDQLKRRFPGLPVEEWSQGSASMSPGVAVTPLGGANATNVNDVLAIGKKRWEQPFLSMSGSTSKTSGSKSFSHCFANGGRRIATTYPQVDAKSGRITTLEMAINDCLALHQEPTLDPAKPRDLLVLGSLSAYLRSLSVGQKLNVRVATPAAREQYQSGRTWFQRRLGEKNLACASCHVLDAGKTIDEAAGQQLVLMPAVGQVLAWPRVEAGGQIRLLHQQFQRCMKRTGAEPFDIGSTEYNQLEYFLSSVSNGLTLRIAVPVN